MKKIDPIHFFNARGFSVLTQEWQGERIAELEKENEELRTKLQRTLARLKQARGAPEDGAERPN